MCECFDCWGENKAGEGGGGRIYGMSDKNQSILIFMAFLFLSTREAIDHSHILAYFYLIFYAINLSGEKTRRKRKTFQMLLKHAIFQTVFSENGACKRDLQSIPKQLFNALRWLFSFLHNFVFLLGFSSTRSPQKK